jgi:tetratricopeptide (TPR) repeat protein
MLARKPSREAHFGHCFSVIFLVALLTTPSFSDEKLQNTNSTIIDNPFAAEAKPTEKQRQTVQPRGGATIYQNPFVAESAAPPLDTSVFSGALSRLHTFPLPEEATSPVRTAILTLDPLVPGKSPQTVQTALLEIDRPMVELLPYLGGNPLALDDADDFHSSAANVDASPLMISQYFDSPEGWLGQAQDAARSADSLKELSTVLDLCQRGLKSIPAADVASQLRGLAAWAHNRRGEMLADQHRISDAMADFDKAIALDPECSLAIHNRAVTLAQQQELSQALLDLNRVIELNPGLGVAYRNRAELLGAMGRWPEAVLDYDRAIQHDPADAALYAARAYAYQQTREFHRAMADLNEAIRLAPDSAEYFTQRGNVAAASGDYPQAIADFHKALAIDAHAVEACRNLAWLHATCPDDRYRNAEQSLLLARKALGLTPEDPLVLEALAAAHACAGRFAEAVQVQRQAVAATPRDLIEPLQQRLILYQQRQP